MFKKAVLLSIFLGTILGSFAYEYNWGVKYGAGVSSAYGDDSRYNIHYDIRTIGTTTADLGYLDVDSRKAAAGLSQSFGTYLEFLVAKKMDSVWLLSELQWQRYNFTYEFTGSPLSTNSLILSSAFADTLEGSIVQTLDYLTIPVLIKLKQESMVNTNTEHYDGAYVYFGPSFSILLNNQSGSFKGIKALQSDVDSFVSDSYTDSNPAEVYAGSRRESAGDKVLYHKVDFVFGMGFNLKNIFNMGICKDEFSLDIRANAGLYPIGNATTKTEFKLYSVLFSLGVKL